MASECIPHDNWMDTLTPEEEASVARARADVEAGRVVSNVSPAALEQFCALADAEAHRLLANVEALQAWFAAHA